MPPYKEPKTLENVCLNAVAVLVLNACDSVEQTYGNVDEEICRCKLEILRGNLVSKIRPLFDELCRVVLEEHVRRDEQHWTSVVERTRYSRDVRSLLTVISCEHTKTLNLRRITSQSMDTKFLNNDLFLRNRISKLRNIVKLDFGQVMVTDGMFDEISRVCKNLREISLKSNLEFSSKDSVDKLLACEKLEVVNIEFVQWSDKREIIACVKRFVRRLRQLRRIHFDEIGTVLLGERKPTSLRTLTEKCVNLESLGSIVALCPHLAELDIDARFSPQQERDKMLVILAESSLSLRSLHLRHFSFTRELERLFKLKGNNLLKLTLSLNAGTITYDDVCTVGTNCPNLEQLEIIETCAIISLNFFGVPKFRIHPPNIPPRIFVHLKRLVLKCDSKWDRTILPLVLAHAKNLESIDLTNVFAKNVDAITETLSANPLKELKSFRLVSERYGSEMAVSIVDKKSIQCLVDNCSRLTSLELDCVFADGAILYLDDLERRKRDGNLDLKLSYKHLGYAFNICDVGVPGDYILREDY